MKRTAIGLIELSSIAAGFAVADVLLKAAAVELLINRTICSGKYLVLIGGEVAAVEAGAAPVARRGLLLNKVVISAPSRELFGESL